MTDEYHGKERRRAVLTSKDKDELVTAITNHLLEQAPEKLWGALYTQAGKGSFKIAFTALRYGIIIWISSHWQIVTSFFKKEGM